MVYGLTANTEDMTYTYEAISSVALIGNATDAEWDPAAAVELTPSDDFETWTVTTHLKAGEFKFMTEHDWGKPNFHVGATEVTGATVGSQSTGFFACSVPYTGLGLELEAAVTGIDTGKTLIAGIVGQRLGLERRYSV